MKRLADSKETSPEKGETGCGLAPSLGCAGFKEHPQISRMQCKEGEIIAPKLDSTASAEDHQLSHFRLKKSKNILSTSKQGPHPRSLAILSLLFFTPYSSLNTTFEPTQHMQLETNAPENSKKNYLMSNNSSHCICMALSNSQSAFFVYISSLTPHHHPLQ